ncbi:MAG: YbaK/EbsC family protein [Pseudomonadota bacterium]
MTIAHTLQDYMAQRGVQYELLPHPRALTSMETAEAAHISGDCLAKAVMLEDDGGYVMAVLPATHQVRVNRLSGQLQRKLRLATERDFSDLFRDCELGAIPPLGVAYGIPTVVDDSLAEQADIYFEAGDHEELVHVNGGQFMGMLSEAEHGRFSSHL